MTERAGQLGQFKWPEFNAALLAAAMRWLMGMLILAGLAWLANLAIRRRAEQREKRKTTALEGLEMLNDASLSQSAQQQLGDG
jgi:hypothetical protein